MSGLLVDCETNGLEHREVVDLAYCEIDIIQGQLHLGTPIVQRFNPATPWEAGAVAVHFIAPADVADCRPSAEAAMPECEFVVGHNCDFDCDALHNTTAKRICTLAISRGMWPMFKSHKLGAVYIELFGMTPPIVTNLRQSHTAVGDIGILIAVLQRIVNVAQVPSLDELYELSQSCRVPTHMPFGKHRGMPIVEVPQEYKNWLLRQPDVDQYLRTALAQ